MTLIGEVERAKDARRRAYHARSRLLLASLTLKPGVSLRAAREAEMWFLIPLRRVPFSRRFVRWRQP